MSFSLILKYYKTGNLRVEQSYWNNQLHGISKEWSSSGNLTSVMNFHHGEPHGKVTIFRNGKVYFEKNYYHGILNGPYRSWWENGQIMEEGTYKHGEKTGIFRWYYSNGSLWKEYSFSS